MKLRDLERHLALHGAVKVREGANHAVWHAGTDGRSVVPRHREVKESVARAICDQLRVPRPR